jgi:predicted ArsR family transcriptional regulator
MQGVFNRRFLETTRGQVVVLLRRGPRTVDELAQALNLTDNGVRVHLATLERDGAVRQSGVRRGEGAGKPASVYELTPEAEALFSRAYVPVLGALLEEVVAQLPPERSEAVLEGVGRRLAATVMPPSGLKFEARVDAAVGILAGLGGAVDLENQDGTLVIRGCSCPLSSAVARRPEACQVVEALLSEVIGVKVRQCCRHGDRPSCCFEVLPKALASPVERPQLRR